MPQAPFRLRCEFSKNPIGISVQQPRLSWWVSDDRDAEVQSAYEILVATSERLLDSDQGDLWQSGRVDSDRCAYVAYAGPELASGQRAWWKVRTFDSDGLSSGWSKPAYFEAGLMGADDWEGNWIATDLQGSLNRPTPVAALRREFDIDDEVLRGRLYVAALGDYQVEINGTRLPGSTFPAVWCDYNAEVYYQTFDVTEVLKEGPNAAGLLLADGYYAGALCGAGRNVYGVMPKVRAMLTIDLADGRQLRVSTDQRWHWTASWIVAAEVNGGEDVDVRQYLDGWSRPGFIEQRWLPAALVSHGGPTLVSQQFESLSFTRQLRPADSVQRPRSGWGERMMHTYDFGQALVGRCEISLACSGSDRVTVYYSQQDTFEDCTVDFCTTSADCERWVFRPEFATHSFRHVRIEFNAARTRIEEVVALRLGYSQPPALTFRSDHATLNELMEIMNNSVEGVAMSAPLRGVSAAERLPDAAYLVAWVPFFAHQDRAHALVRKWLDDLAVPLSGAEAVPAYAPGMGDYGRADGDEIAYFESLVHILWALYRHQDDVESLRDHYPLVRAGALAIRYSCPGLLRETPYEALYGQGLAASLVATAGLYGSLKTASRIAGVLGQLTDHEQLETIATDIRAAFRNRYLTRDGHLAYSDQSTCVAALYHNLLEDTEREQAERELIDHIARANYHCEVVPGVLRALLPTLTRAGRLDLAYMVLLQTSQPSWMGSVRAGDRLVTRQSGSFDIADIGLLEWLIESMAGILIDQDYSVDRNGYRSIDVKPRPPFGQQFLAGSPVRFVEAKLATLQGVFEVNWRIEDTAFEVEVVIPPSCQATVTMPDGVAHGVRSGRHRFVMDFGAGGDGVPMLVERKVG